MQIIAEVCWDRWLEANGLVDGQRLLKGHRAKALWHSKVTWLAWWHRSRVWPGSHKDCLCSMPTKLFFHFYFKASMQRGMWVTPQHGPSHQPKHPLQLKTKCVGWERARLSGKAQKTRGGLSCTHKSVSSPLIRVSIGWVISLIDVDCSYRRMTSAWFSELL